MEYVKVDRDGPVGFITLDRPHKRNAIEFEALGYIIESLHKLERDDDVKVIVIRGTGESFCAGHDFDSIVKHYGIEGPDGEVPRRPSQRQRLLVDRQLADSYMAIQYVMKPLIVQVQGTCVGAGMYMAELADLVVCAEDAVFSHAEQRLGLAGNSWHLGMQILLYGPKKAREFLLFGEELSGLQAAEIGLANVAVPREDLEATTREWALRVAQNAKDALVMGKAVHHMALDGLGMSRQFVQGYVGHALYTNIRYEEDEFSFFRERRDKGNKSAFTARDDV